MSTTVSFMEYEDIPSIVDLELDLYPAECVFPEDSWKELFSKNKYINLIAKDETGKVIGGLNIMPLTKDTFNKILDGTFDAWEDLKYNTILPLEDNMTADFHFGSFVTKEKEVAAQLMFGLIKYARLLKKKNIKINRLSCNIGSQQGQDLCDKLGFEKLHEFEPYGDGFTGKSLILDMNKESKSFLINKIRKILF